MTILSVNVNKIATLRNSRGKNMPDLLKVAQNMVSFGAQGITVHPRPDGRHIRHDDVFQLRKNISVELNVEGYPDERFLQLICDTKPAQVTFVPDPPEAITSNAGWQVVAQSAILEKAIERVDKLNIRTSVFVDPFQVTTEDLQLLQQLGCKRIELYTEAYADSYDTNNKTDILSKYVEVAKLAQQIDLGVNAGHDLNQHNLRTFAQAIPFLAEVSIGHALICESLYDGLETTIQRYLDCLKNYN